MTAKKAESSLQFMIPPRCLAIGLGIEATEEADQNPQEAKNLAQNVAVNWGPLSACQKGCHMGYHEVKKTAE